MSDQLGLQIPKYWRISQEKRDIEAASSASSFEVGLYKYHGSSRMSRTGRDIYRISSTILFVCCYFFFFFFLENIPILTLLMENVLDRWDIHVANYLILLDLGR